MKFRSISIFNIFTLVALLALFLGLTPTFPIQASPLSAGNDFLWAKSMGGLSDDFGIGIAVDSSGNIYTTGTFQGLVDFDPGPGTFPLTGAGSEDIFITKLDRDGNLLWARSLGSASAEQSTNIVVDSNNNVYITGNFVNTLDFDPGAGIFNLTGAGNYDIFILKLDGNGNFVWARNMGGAGYDAGNDIAVDSNFNVYTTGSFTGTADFDPDAGVFTLTGAGNYDVFVSKLDGNGNLIWAENMGGTGYDAGNGLTLDLSGNILITGNFEAPSQSSVDFDPGAGTFNLTNGGGFLSKLDRNGVFVWAGNLGDFGSDVAVDSSGNIYAMGGFKGTKDFDPGAGIFNLTSAGWQDTFVTKLAGNGNFLWAKGMGGPTWDYGKDIVVDSGGNAYITGEFSGTSDFDPGPGTVNLICAGDVDIFVSRLNTNGTFVWARNMGSAFSYGDKARDNGSAVALDPGGNVYLTGAFAGTADFDTGAGVANLTSSAETADIFISKLGNDGTPSITSFTVTSPSASLNIPITAFTTLDAAGVTGYLITTSATPPAAGDSGWSNTTPTNYPVVEDGNYTLYPWVKDNAGRVSAVFDFPVQVSVDSAPSLTMNSTTTNPTNASPITVKVTFSENVFNFVAGDIITTNGTINNFAGNGRNYTFDLTPAANGLVTANVAAGVAQDGTGHDNLAAPQFSRSYDSFPPTVNSFTTVSSSSSHSIPITTFTASDAVGYLITTSAIPPAADNPAWSAAAPTIYVVKADGTYSLFSWVKDAAGNISLVSGSPVNVTVDATAPTVVSSIRTSTTPTTGNSVDFTITFSEPVMGVSADDFSLTTNGLSGAMISGVSGSGDTYTVSINTGNGNGTIRLDISANATITDLIGNPLLAGIANNEIYTVIKTPTFADVPFGYWAWGYIERLYDAGVTGGCSINPLNYCPDSTVTRAQMAVFLLKGIHGSGFTPPAAGAGTSFTDVTNNYWAASWIKQLAAEGITGGCGAGIYCPDSSVTRAQMAVFLLKARYGASYTPPSINGSTSFGDVTTTYWAAAWIKQLAVEGVTSGCGNENYCPDNSVTRAEMAVFLVKAFGLP